MKNYFPLIKKFLTYGLMAIGVIAIAWYALVFLFGGGGGITPQKRGTPQKSGEISFPNPLRSGGTGLALPSVSFLGAPENESYNYRVDSSQSVRDEGELTERKVIKNGTLALIVTKAEETAEIISAIAKRMDGFVQNSYIYEVSDGVKSGSVTIRVPADRFDGAMEEIKQLAVKVERENVDASDVTEQFVDLEAQLRNLKAEEAQYLEIMKRAFTVEDTLKVAERLSNVRGRIEQIEGQLTYLSRQVDMSSITVTLVSEADIEVFGIRWRPLFVAKQAFREMLANITGYIDAMIRFGFRLPILILWLATLGVGAGIAWRIARWIFRKFFASRK